MGEYGQWKLVFSHILCSEMRYINTKKLAKWKCHKVSMPLGTNKISYLLKTHRKGVKLSLLYEKFSINIIFNKNQGKPLDLYAILKLDSKLLICSHIQDWLIVTVTLVTYLTTKHIYIVFRLSRITNSFKLYK